MAFVVAEVVPPTGTVTFLFTDVEGSTRMWEEHTAEMERALEHHDEIMREVIPAHGGYVFSTAGDAFVAAFARADEAVHAAGALQAAVAAEPWPAVTPIRVRMGIHTGETQERDGDYFGPALNRAARICSAGHGGQTLLSSVTASLVAGVSLIDLGEHRLKDLSAPDRLWQLGESEFAPVRSLDRASHNLPIVRTPLLGRDGDLAAVVERVSSGPLVTLTGIGGTGKTRLALEVAAVVADEFADGVWFVDLVPVTGEDDVAAAVAGAAGLDVRLEDPLGSLAELMAGRDALFVLDNAEHLTDAVADLVDEVLARAVGPTFLVTSRESLDLPDEQHVALAPLDADDDESPAVALFALTAERLGVVIDDVERPVLAEICRRLDGLPLAVELAAGQLRHLGVGDLLSHLDRRFELLGGGRGRRRRRQASLQAVLEGSWDLLDHQEQDLLRQLAAFPGTFELDLVETAWGPDAALVLAGLVDRSLVTPSADRSTYRLLETVKLFAQQRWTDVDDPDRYRERHAQALLSTLGSWDDDFRLMSIEVAAWHVQHLDDIFAADDYLRSHGRAVEAAQLWSAAAIAHHIGSQTNAVAAIRHLRNASSVEELRPGDQAVLELAMAGAAMAAREPQLLVEASTRAADLAAKAGPESSVVYALALNLKSWMTMVRDLHGALALLRESEQVATEAGAPLVGLSARSYQLVARAIHGDLDIVREAKEIGSIEATTASYVPHGLGGALWMAQLLVDPLAARDAERKVREVAARLGIEPHPIFHLSEATASAAAGRADEALTDLKRAEEALRRAGNDDGLPDLLLPPCALAWSLDEPELAARWLTAVRLASRATQNLLATAGYKQLRDRVGLVDRTPELEDTTAVYAEARQWLVEMAHADTG